jgi:glycosyltransferase involved in cell wall biosynthesis
VKFNGNFSFWSAARAVLEQAPSAALPDICHRVDHPTVNMNALFLHNPADLDSPIPGGVQLCSREFLEIIRAASTTTTTLLGVSPARDFITRLRRALRLGSYLGFSPGNTCELKTVLKEQSISHVFLNRAELLRFAPVIKQIDPTIQVIVMSHGNQTGDDLYEVSGPARRFGRGLKLASATWKLGMDLQTESWHRHRFIDGVVVMSREEEVLERWLGAQRTVVLPRLITPDFINWSPTAGRCGYVGTLDHTPNRVALEKVCVELDRCGDHRIELRVVGGPVEIGRQFAARFTFVNYLGRLDDDALRTEAATWGLFLNPILWLARGASMKLGMALAWGLPVLTTKTGARGYEWSTGDVPVCADSAANFARELVRLLSDPAALVRAKHASELAAQSAPKLHDLASRLRTLANGTE